MAFLAHEGGIEGQYIVDIRLGSVEQEREAAEIDSLVAKLVGKYGGDGGNRR